MPARRARAVLAILVSGLAVAVAAGSVLLLSQHDPARRVPPSLAVSSARRPRPDPLTGRATSFLATRSGTVLAAVYDLDTRQTWTAGQGPPQAEASVVKVDILEALLVQRGRNGLTRREAALARLMIERSDNNAATGWVSGGGRDYLIAVFTTGNPTPQYGVTTIAGLSSIVWADLG